jgi:hypothetical protein
MSSAKMNQRIQDFIALVNESLFNNTQEKALLALWDELTHYTPCHVVIASGERQGQTCGKPSLKEKDTCMCHTPREKKEKPVEEDKPRCGLEVKTGLCIRFCVEGTDRCTFHQPKEESKPCEFLLMSGKKKGEVCGKDGWKGTTLCHRHSQDTEEMKQQKAEKESKKQEKEEKKKEKDGKKQEKEEKKQKKEEKKQEKEEKKKEKDGKKQEKEEKKQAKVDKQEQEQEQVQVQEKEEKKEQVVENQMDNKEEKMEVQEKVVTEVKVVEKEKEKEEEKEVKSIEKVEKQVVKEESVEKKDETLCSWVMKAGVKKGQACGKKCNPGQTVCVLHA